MTIKAIILAAGRGSRMRELTTTVHKCMTKLWGKPLLAWQLQAFRGSGFTNANIAIVTGYLAETFTEPVNYFHNLRWQETNMLYSLKMAAQWLATYPCIVAYADLIYSDLTIKKLLISQADIAITYDPNWQQLWQARFANPLLDAETFQVNGQQLVTIGDKTANINEIQGQYMGLLKFTPTGWRQVDSYLNSIATQKVNSMSMTELLKNLLQLNIYIEAIKIDTKDRWFEVDTAHDLRVYSAMPNPWYTS